MSTNSSGAKQDFLNSWQDNAHYFEMLKLVSSLSNLFAQSDAPFLDYRLAENIFCRFFSSENKARDCSVYDAVKNELGIGIKTFLINRGSSIEKIAEFNKLKPELDLKSHEDLAIQLATFFNRRIDSANSIYGVTDSIYHIIGRKPGELSVFNDSFRKIDPNSIRNVHDDIKSLSFQESGFEYRFNKSKSVLMRRFELPKTVVNVPVELIEDPLDLLSNLLTHVDTRKKRPLEIEHKRKSIRLPLYSEHSNGVKYVPEKSGLNQWHAGGRKRDENEVYIPVPARFHREHPNFFPSRDTPFVLVLPDKTELEAKICQDNDKALMSCPNSALGEWLLRKVLKKKPGELVTMQDLDVAGIDSVIIDDTGWVDETNTKIYEISFTENDGAGNLISGV